MNPAPDSNSIRRVTLACLWVGTLLRLFCAAWRIDLFWPDEHFQTLEPASHVVFGRGFLSWEWTVGYRSWIVPSLYIPLLWICKLFGLTGGVGLIIACRVYTASISSFSVWRLTQTARILDLSPVATLLATAAISLSPSMILWAPTTLADNWASSLLWILLPAVLVRWRSSHFRSWIFIGFCAGIGISIKTTQLFSLLGFTLALLLTQNPRKLGPFALGAILSLIPLGALDWVTWGRPFHSIIKQLTEGEQTSRFYGTFPWFYYLHEIRSNLGWFLWITLSTELFFLITWWREFLSFFSSRSALFVTTLAPSIAIMVGHSLIPHKELRFLLPVFPVFYLCLAFWLPVWFSEWVKSLWTKKPIFVQTLTFAVIACVTLTSFQQMSATRLYLTGVDISQLEGIIYDRHRLSAQHEDCILLLDHHWSFTRGQLILGQKAKMIEAKSASELEPTLFQKCIYAILPERMSSSFEAEAKASWHRLNRSPSGYLLYERQ